MQLLRAGLFVLTLSFVAVFAGCGGNPEPSNNNGNANPNPGGANNPPSASSCPQVTSAISQGPMTGVAPMPPAAPIPAPQPGTTAAGSVCVSSPANGASVSSPAHIVASTTMKNIAYMRVYVDDSPQQFTFWNTLDSLVFMSPGTHTVVIVATDKSGNNASTSFSLNVASAQPYTIADIQKIPNWEFCSALFPAGHPRAGQLCAAGLGNAESTMTENQSTPSMSGASAKLTIGGPKGYSNALWTKFLGGGSFPTRFTYDMYFMIDNPDLPQALEFDVNQAFNNRRWVFGTECNFRGSGKWDVWDGNLGWQPTNVPCVPFPANTWIHLVWEFERVDNQVHYISVTVADKKYPLDLYYSNEPVWTMESIDVAFQMDGNFAQQPYNVWLDKVNLTVQ
ncbi:MAG TPA: hypothetical protein VN577_05555 [Terriglobales bacterium]|nr:hypothetical protein [Terriglobales bacterium]